MSGESAKEVFVLMVLISEQRGKKFQYALAMCNTKYLLVAIEASSPRKDLKCMLLPPYDSSSEGISTINDLFVFKCCPNANFLCSS